VSADASGMTIDVSYNGVVQPPPPQNLTAIISLLSGSYNRKNGVTVPITATVDYGTAAQAGAGVIFTLVTTSGYATTQTMTTGTDGTATWNYKLSKKSLVGTYSVSAVATYTPPGEPQQTASSNTAAFSAQ
jgi:hypothetical protein